MLEIYFQVVYRDGKSSYYASIKEQVAIEVAILQLFFLKNILFSCLFASLYDIQDLLINKTLQLNKYCLSQR